MKCRQTISIFIILYLVALFTTPGFAVNRPFIAVIKSWDLESYNNALQGFNEVLEQNDIKPWILDDYNMQGSEEKGREIVTQIVSKEPDLVLTLGTRATRVAVQGIKDVPVVFSMVLEPVASGLVESMAASGNNLTGASMDIPLKVQFETLKAVVPGLKKIGVLYNVAENKTIIDRAATIAQEMGLALVAVAVNSEKDVPGAMTEMGKTIDAFWMVTDRIVYSPAARQFILLHTLDKKIPFMGISPQFVKAGALLSLSCDAADIGRQSGELAIKILNGAKPTDIPISLPSKIRLSINLKTAKRIGLNIPEDIVDKADEVFK